MYMHNIIVESEVAKPVDASDITNFDDAINEVKRLRLAIKTEYERGSIAAAVTPRAEDEKEIYHEVPLQVTTGAITPREEGDLDIIKSPGGPIQEAPKVTPKPFSMCLSVF